MKNVNDIAIPLAALFMTSGCATVYCGSCAPVHVPRLTAAATDAGHKTELEINALLERADAAGLRVTQGADNSRRATFNTNTFYDSIHARLSAAIPDRADDCPKKVVVNMIVWNIRDKINHYPNNESFLSSAWFGVNLSCKGKAKDNLASFEDSLTRSAASLHDMTFVWAR